MCRHPPDGEGAGQQPRNQNRYLVLGQNFSVGGSDSDTSGDSADSGWTASEADRRAAKRAAKAEATAQRRLRKRAHMPSAAPHSPSSGAPAARTQPTPAHRDNKRTMTDDEVAARTTRAPTKSARTPTAAPHRSKATIQREQRRARSESRPPRKLRWADVVTVRDLRDPDSTRGSSPESHKEPWPPLPRSAQAAQGPIQVSAPREVKTGERIPPAPLTARASSAPVTPPGAGPKAGSEAVVDLLDRLKELALSRQKSE